MQYCPNCSAFQHEENAAKCRKCGYDMADHAARQKVERSNEQKKENDRNKEDLSLYDKDCPCPICTAPTRFISESVELVHEGQRINMNGIKLMGGEITKRTQTHYQMYVKGLLCFEGHKFFMEVGSKIRALCPMCHEQMIEYGSSLYSCTRCNKHFSKGDWETPANEDVLRNNGWIEAD